MFLKAHSVLGVYSQACSRLFCSPLIFLPLSIFFYETLLSVFLTSLNLFRPISLLVLLLSNCHPATLPSESTKTDLCSGHHKTATILGCGWREIKPHHKDGIVPSSENRHKWDKYCCLFSWPPQGLASAWACD